MAVLAEIAKNAERIKMPIILGGLAIILGFVVASNNLGSWIVDALTGEQNSYSGSAQSCPPDSIVVDSAANSPSNIVCFDSRSGRLVPSK